MAMNFPASPTVGQQYPSPAVPGSPVYSWNGTAWIWGTGNVMTDAPSDGTIYGRQNATWVNVIPTGTTMLFVQSAAPTGWTRVTTYDDALLRIVGSATPSSGGTNGFQATYNVATATGGTSITQANLPNVNFSMNNVCFTSVGGSSSGVTGSSPSGTYTFLQEALACASGGSGTAHTHPITRSIKYVDSLIAHN